MFADMQWDYHRLKEKYEEAGRAATRYRKDLHTCKNELKEASEVVASCRHAILALEKEKEYADLEKDRAKADLKKAKATLLEQDRAFNVAALERDILKGELAGVGEKVARAREEAIQEYRDNFKDTNDYLDLIRDAIEEYKMVVKKVDPFFDADYYDNLILGEPQTPTPDDSVGF